MWECLGFGFFSMPKYKFMWKERKERKSHSQNSWVFSRKSLLCASVSYLLSCFWQRLTFYSSFLVFSISVTYFEDCCIICGSTQCLPLIWRRLGSAGTPSFGSRQSHCLGYSIWQVSGRMRGQNKACPMKEWCLQSGMFIPCSAWVKDIHQEDKQPVIHDIARNSVGKLGWRGGVHGNRAGY